MSEKNNKNLSVNFLVGAAFLIARPPASGDHPSPVGSVHQYPEIMR